ncbi:hypothetical protein C5E11_13435 [Clavibacter michiganensis]|nr:hypothetical protein [Clavibacter michiganensis]PPF61875.1 hypothetical protein C5E11_13435 [Clavibacter michiganensis]
MTQSPPAQRQLKPNITSAVVSLAAGVAAIPVFVFGFTIAAWACALLGLIAGIAGVRRAQGGIELVALLLHTVAVH